jgi:hypothetical protein
MTDLKSLSPPALAAAMRTGTADWGHEGSILKHAVYVEPFSGSRQLCHCGCRRRVKYISMANGVGMATGCELSMRRFVKQRGKR